MAAQSAFTIISRIREEAPSVDVLKALAALDAAWQGRRAELLTDLPELHYCSLALVERAGVRYLTFEGNVDGAKDRFWQRLDDAWRAPLEAIYASCQGFSPGELVRLFAADDEGPGTWYVAWLGRSASEIRYEEALHGRIEAFLARPGLPSEPSAIHAAVRAFVRDDLPALDPVLAAWAQPPPARAPFLVRRGRAIVQALGWLLLALAGIALVALLAVLVFSPWTALRTVGCVLALLAPFGLAALALRRLEQRDAQGSPMRSPAILRAVWRREDRSLTNHMLGVTRVKPGWFRMLLLRLALMVVGLAHRFWFNRGDLGGIPSIHFARWVIRKDSRDLLFFSNYDGSWEGYLGDFIDKASIGLNSIWSNTERYPRTAWLIGEGARDEPRFKAFGRNTMVPTRVWYAAYPNLSVQQIEKNARIRKALYAPLEPEAAREWLRLS